MGCQDHHKSCILALLQRSKPPFLWEFRVCMERGGGGLSKFTNCIMCLGIPVIDYLLVLLIHVEPQLLEGVIWDLVFRAM